MKESEFRQYCATRGLGAEESEAAVLAVRDCEEALVRRGTTLESATVDSMRGYVADLMASGRITRQGLLALARYCYVADHNELFVYLVGLLSGREVLPSMARRTAEIAGAEASAAIFGGLELPPLGTPPEQFPAVTRAVIERLTATLPPDTCRRVLAGNHHGVPAEGFLALRDRYLEAGVDAVLDLRRQQLLSDLEDHARTGKPWYEQIITPAVVEFVRQHPEIQAGVRHGDRIHVSKIPFAPQQYLEETDPRRKRYYQCHCPLARASILAGQETVSPLFCYCSGGYEKLPFDVVFGEEVEVEVMESALGGDMGCRFEIKIPEGKLR